MKALIVSDTHGMNDNLIKVIKKVGPVDLLIHAGDAHGAEDIMREMAGCGVKVVLGNNDFCYDLKYEEEFDFDGYHVLLTHGHKYSVYYGTDRLFYIGKERGADIVIYGHTHVPSLEYDNDFHMWCVNPGSLSLPRQEGRKPSYAIMETDRQGEVHFTINYL